MREQPTPKKTERIRIVTVSMPPEMHEELKARALANGSTFSGYVRYLLKKLPAQREEARSS
jgi:Arc/MetJ-type ribon-helix-helix transcriptional regulator